MSKPIPTRSVSKRQEKAVAKKLGGRVTANSGATDFKKGDVIIDGHSLLIECKTAMTEKASFSLKKEWFEKNEQERFAQRMDYSAIVFDFGGTKQKQRYIAMDLDDFKRILEEAERK